MRVPAGRFPADVYPARQRWDDAAEVLERYVDPDFRARLPELAQRVHIPAAAAANPTPPKVSQLRRERIGFSPGAFDGTASRAADRVRPRRHSS